MSEYNTKVYLETGGDKLVILSGGEIEAQSGSTIDFQGDVTITDDAQLIFGDTTDCALEWDTAQTQDCLQLGLGASNTLMVIEKADMSVDKTLGASTYPQIIVYDSDADNYLTLSSSGDDIALVGSSNDIDVRCGLAAGDALNLQAYDAGNTAYEDMITLASHGTLPTMVLHASGGITVNAAIVASDEAGTGAGSIVTVEGEDLGLQSTDATTAGAGGDVNIIAGAADTAGTGGDVDIDAGAALGANAGGAIELTAGAGGAAGAGGPVTILAGAPASGAADGGDISVTGGAAGATLGTGGDVSLVGGASPNSGTGGDVNITAGASSTSGAGGAVDIDAGASGGANVGGALELTGGDGGAAGAGGPVGITGGAPASGAADGGDITITGGAAGATSGTGGDVNVVGGATPTSGTGGDVNVTAGASSAAGAGGAVDIDGGAGTGALGGDVELTGGAGNGAFAGGAIDIDGGAGGVNGDGGAVEVTGGAGNTAADGGAITITGGAAGTAGTGGDVNVVAGASATAGAGGAVDIDGGAGTGNVGGAVEITGGAGNAANAGGAIDIDAGAGGAAGAGGDVTINGGVPASGTADGGDVTLTGGAAGATGGTAGEVTLTAGAVGGGTVGGITLNGTTTLSDQAGTGGGIIDAVAGQTLSINLSDNVATALDIQEATNDYITCVTTDSFEEVEFGVPVDMERGRKVSTYFEIFDDFLYQAIAETDTPWILNAGTDTLAIDAAILATQENGVIRLETGDASGTFSADGSQIVCHIPMQANNGGLVFETRLNIDSAITDISVNAGFTDSTALEEPFSIAAGSYTSNATDAAVFVYDTAATDDEFHMCAVDSGVDDAGCATTGTAPVADVFNLLRIEVSADGATIRYYIDGVLEGTLTGDTGVSPTANLFATVTVNATTTTAKDLDIDFVYAAVVRG